MRGSFHDLLQQPELVVSVENSESLPETHVFRVTAQHPRAEGMKRAEPEALCRTAQDGTDPLTHFARRLVGERDSEHLPRKSAARDEDVSEARGEHTGLPRPGTRQHEERAIQRLHRNPLLDVQPGKIIRHAAGTAATWGRTPRRWAMADVSSGRFSV